MKFFPGLVSITFRELNIDELIHLSQSNGLQAIEWGGDIHVPTGDTEKALIVAGKMKNAGLVTTAYGSYYKIGKSEPAVIEKVISCAKTLDTDTIRVWAYVKNYGNCSSTEYANAVADARRICNLAPDFRFGLECHNGTLTEDYRDALRYLRDVDRPNFKMFWQPNQFRSHTYNVEACATLLPYIVAVHVFSWEGADNKTTFFPLYYHAERWADYLAILKNADADRLPLMLEFMHDKKPETFFDTAKVLLRWIENT